MIILLLLAAVVGGDVGVSFVVVSGCRGGLVGGERYCVGGFDIFGGGGSHGSFVIVGFVGGGVCIAFGAAAAAGDFAVADRGVGGGCDGE